MGFGVPIDSWLRGPLRDWAEDLLDPARLRREGFLDPEPIRASWQRASRRAAPDWQYPLWNVLMFQAWLEHVDGRSAAAAVRRHRGLVLRLASARPGAGGAGRRIRGRSSPRASAPAPSASRRAGLRVLPLRMLRRGAPGLRDLAAVAEIFRIYRLRPA